jgi:hypothetical protein
MVDQQSDDYPSEAIRQRFKQSGLEIVGATDCGLTSNARNVELVSAQSAWPAVQEVFQQAVSELRGILLPTPQETPQVLKAIFVLGSAIAPEFEVVEVRQNALSGAETSVTEGGPTPGPSRARPTFLVFLCGPDGAGKTTAIRGLTGLMNATGIPYRRYYSLNEVIRHAIILSRWIIALIRGLPADRRSFNRYRHSLSWHRDRPPSNPFWWRLRKRIFLLTAVADCWIGWFRAKWLEPAGTVVLIETSPYDFFAKYHMPRFPVLQRMLAPLIPAPHVTFLLEATPAAILSRKGDLTGAEISLYYARLAELRELLPAPAGEWLQVRTDSGFAIPRLAALLIRRLYG